MATYCCDLIFCVSLALIGGRADERTTAPSTGSLGIGSRAATAVATVVDVDATAVLGANTGSPARDAAGGKAPRGVNAAPVWERPTA